MKTKQIPDDFRDWIEARTFEISAPIAWPTGLPLDYLKRIIIRQSRREDDNWAQADQRIY